MDPQPPPQPTERPLISGDAEIPCLRCGFDLRGIQLGGNCPECGGVVNQVATTGGGSGRAIASMVLGIVSIVTCMAYGVIGLPCGIIAVYLAPKARIAVQEGTAPPSSLGMAKAGKVCGIIGIVLNGITILYLVGAIAFFAFNI